MWLVARQKAHDYFAGNCSPPAPIFFIMPSRIMVIMSVYLAELAGGSKALTSGFESWMSLKLIVTGVEFSVVSIFTGKPFKSVAFQTVDSY